MPLSIAVILLFSLITFVGVVGPIRDAVYLIKKDSEKRNLFCPNYPRWYINTPKWVIKYIWPADSIIPFYLYYEIVVGVVSAVIGPIDVIIVFLIGYRYTVFVALCHMGIVAIVEIITPILDRIMWKQAKKNKTLD